MSKKDGGADSLVSAASRVGAVDGRQNRHPGLIELGMPEKSGARATAIRIKFFLLGQFDTAAVDQPYQRNVQPFGQVGAAENIFSLPGYPGPGVDLIVKANDNRPFTRYFGQTVKHIGGAFRIVFGVVQRVQRIPGTRVHQVLQALPDG